MEKLAKIQVISLKSKLLKYENPNWDPINSYWNDRCSESNSSNFRISMDVLSMRNLGKVSLWFELYRPSECVCGLFINNMKKK